MPAAPPEHRHRLSHRRQVGKRNRLRKAWSATVNSRPGVALARKLQAARERRRARRVLREDGASFSSALPDAQAAEAAEAAAAAAELALFDTKLAQAAPAPAAPAAPAAVPAEAPGVEEEAWRGAEPLAVEDSQLAEEALESAEPSPPPVPAEATVVVEEAAEPMLHDEEPPLVEAAVEKVAPDANADGNV